MGFSPVFFFEKNQVLLSICDACDGGCACNPHLGDVKDFGASGQLTIRKLRSS